MKFFRQTLDPDEDPYFTFDQAVNVMHAGPTRPLEGFTWDFTQADGSRLARTVRFFHKMERTVVISVDEFWDDPVGQAEELVSRLRSRIQIFTEAKFRDTLRQYEGTFGKPVATCVSYTYPDVADIDYFDGGQTLGISSKVSLAVTVLGGVPRDEMVETDSLPLPHLYFQDGQGLLRLLSTGFPSEEVTFLDGMKALQRAEDHGHLTFSEDDPLRRMIGFTDIHARKTYMIPLVQIKRNLHLLPLEIRELFRSPEGRRKLFGA